jgi:hypothetical protein
MIFYLFIVASLTYFILKGNLGFPSSDSVIEKRINDLAKWQVENSVPSNIEMLILQKTENSFRMPHLRSEYYAHLDLDKGIRYQIERLPTRVAVGNIPGTILPENITFVNHHVCYEITFYVCSKIPNIPAIPIYDEYSRKPPNKSNIFNINDTTLRFVPKIFIEIKTATGDNDVFLMYSDFLYVDNKS